jgi:hypothetical protein
MGSRRKADGLTRDRGTPESRHGADGVSEARIACPRRGLRIRRADRLSEARISCPRPGSLGGGADRVADARIAWRTRGPRVGRSDRVSEARIANPRRGSRVRSPDFVSEPRISLSEPRIVCRRRGLACPRRGIAFPRRGSLVRRRDLHVRGADFLFRGRDLLFRGADRESEALTSVAEARTGAAEARTTRRGRRQRGGDADSRSEARMWLSSSFPVNPRSKRNRPREERLWLKRHTPSAMSHGKRFDHRTERLGRGSEPSSASFTAKLHRANPSAWAKQASGIREEAGSRRADGR